MSVGLAGDAAASLALLLDDEVEDLHRGLLGRELPASADGLPEPALRDSMMLVVERTLRTSWSYFRNGTNRGHEFSHSLMIGR